MKRLNVQISSPETDRKIAKPASVIFMSMAWLFLTALVIWLLVDSFGAKPHSSGLLLFILGFYVVLIPIQLARYFRSR